MKDNTKVELREEELDNVVGGTVILSKNAMTVVFNAIREAYRLENCTYKDARDYRDELMDAYPNMPNSEFDAFCKMRFIERGWIKS